MNNLANIYGVSCRYHHPFQRNLSTFPILIIHLENINGKYTAKMPRDGFGFLLSLNDFIRKNNGNRIIKRKVFFGFMGLKC